MKLASSEARKEITPADHGENLQEIRRRHPRVDIDRVAVARVRRFGPCAAGDAEQAHRALPDRRSLRQTRNRRWELRWAGPNTNAPAPPTSMRAGGARRSRGP